MGFFQTDDAEKNFTKDEVALSDIQNNDLKNCPNCQRVTRNDSVYIRGAWVEGLTTLWEGCIVCFAKVFQENASLKQRIATLEQNVVDINAKIRR